MFSRALRRSPDDVGQPGGARVRRVVIVVRDVHILILSLSHGRTLVKDLVITDFLIALRIQEATLFRLSGNLQNTVDYLLSGKNFLNTSLSTQSPTDWSKRISLQPALLIPS